MAKRSKWIMRARLALFLTVIGHVVVAVYVTAQAPTRVESLLDALTSRVATLETRTSLLEQDMGELKWIGRAVVVGILGQLGLAVFGDRRARRSDSEAVRALEYLRRSPGSDDDR